MHIRLNYNWLIISIFFTLYFCYIIFGNYNYSISNCENLQIGQALFNGIDINKRINIYYTLIICLFGILPITYYLFKWFFLKSNLNSYNLTIPIFSSLFGIILILSEIIKIESSTSISFLFIITISSTILSIIGKTFKKLIRFCNVNVQTSIMLISLLLFYLVSFIYNSTIHNPLYYKIIFTLIIIFLVSALILFNLIKKTSIDEIFNYLIPMAISPILIFISVEYSIIKLEKFNSVTDTRMLVLNLLLSTYILFVIIKNIKPFNIKLSNCLKYIFGPSLIIFVVLNNFYNPFYLSSTDNFELANIALPQLNIFEYNKIPFIDFTSSHLLSEQFFGIIFNSIYDFENSLSFLRFDFFLEIIMFFIVYYILNKTFYNSTFSTLFIISFPFLKTLFLHPILIGVIVLFYLIKIKENQSIGQYLRVFAIIFLLLFWRMDTGIATLYSSIFFFPLYFITEKIKINKSNLLISICIILIIIALLIWLSFIIRSPKYIYDHFTMAYHYFSASQAHGYSELTKEIGPQFLIYYFIFPAISICSIIYNSYKIKFNKDESNNNLLHLINFLFLMYIFNFPRGLVRHSFFESDELTISSTFYFGFTLLIISLIEIKKINIKLIGFSLLSFLLILTLKVFPFKQNKTLLESSIIDFKLKNFDSNIRDTNYYKIINDFNPYSNLKSFMDSTLNENQTFIDFSNNPMLYYYCNRNNPSYFCQSLQNTVDNFLQSKFIDSHKKDDAPIVVYSNNPQNWYDKIDGVPNNLRNYLIAEHIYKNYTPYKIIDNKLIWLDNNSDLIKNHYFDTTLINPEIHNYYESSPYINMYFSNSIRTEYLNKIKDNIKINEDRNVITLDENVEKNANLIKIIFSNFPKRAKYTIEVLSDNIKIGELIFFTNSNYNEYMLRLSNQYLWHIKNNKSLKFTSTEKIENMNIEFLSDNQHEY